MCCRYTAGRIRLKDRFGKALKERSFIHPAARAASSAPATPAPGVNSYLPKGVRPYSIWERTRHDVATLWETNRTRFYELTAYFQRRCRRPAPPRGELKACVGLNVSAIK